jgi:hypothetical protein
MDSILMLTKEKDETVDFSVEILAFFLCHIQRNILSSIIIFNKKWDTFNKFVEIWENFIYLYFLQRKRNENLLLQPQKKLNPDNCSRRTAESYNNMIRHIYISPVNLLSGILVCPEM